MFILPAKDSSSMSAFKVPAVANMIVVSKSPSMPDTVFAAFSKACVPVFAALSADNTVEHCNKNRNVRPQFKNMILKFDTDNLIILHNSFILPFR